MGIAQRFEAWIQMIGVRPNYPGRRKQIAIIRTPSETKNYEVGQNWVEWTK